MTDCGDHGGTNRDGDPCGKPEGWGTDFETGKCRHHRGTSPDGESHADNDFAAKTGAWAEDFYDGFLTEGEKKRVEESVEILGTQAGTQEIGRHAASVCLEQFRRTGDERFMRRFESICDKFGIAPADELDVDVDGEVTVDAPAEFVNYESDTPDE